MGCSQSSVAVAPVRSGSSDEKVKIVNKKCPRIRLDAPQHMTTLPVASGSNTYKLSYCYCSQRGFYPNDVSKANQDSYCIVERVASDPNTHLFGIYDGHGEFGDYCSFYAADQHIEHLERVIKKSKGVTVLDNEKTMAIAYTESFVGVNNALHRSDIDDHLSGTTGITVLVRGDVLLVGNVGDSRAIIATEVDGKLKYAPLSQDQTPFRKDERDRVKLQGAVVRTMDQRDGYEPIHENWGAETGDEIDEAGDPPRIWDPELMRPGCAFTRSIGDAYVEQYGVYAEPEILSWKLSTSDKFVVIASDGVFEFLTSQAVVDMISNFSNQIEAAKHVVGEAYRLWLTYDDRTDDITIIIIVIDEFTQQKTVVGRDVSPHEISRSGGLGEAKPVRRVMSKAKRKVISEAWNQDEAIDYDFNANVIEKSPEEYVRLAKMVQANFMFQHLSPSQKDRIFKVMTMKNVSSGEMIIKEGDEGDCMYIIDKGEFNVLKRSDEGVSNVVFTYTSEGAAFGELSLMYGKPRAASIQAKTDGRLWSIGRQAFRAVLMKKKSEGLMKFLRDCPLLKDLAPTQLSRLCELSAEETFQKGVSLARAEEMHWIICIILEGSVNLIPGSDKAQPQSRGVNTFVVKFELARNFVDCVTNSKVRCACIPEAAFIDVAGPQGVSSVKQMVGTEVKTAKKMSLVRQQSIFSLYDKANTTGNQRDFYQLQGAPIVALGEFGYVGTFKHGSAAGSSGVYSSIKVIAKKNAEIARADRGLGEERKFLSALKRSSPLLPQLEGTFQNDAVAMFIYKEVFVCDMANAISSGALNAAMVPYYTACVYSAITTLHACGLMHRFISPGSIYLTNTGVPKLADIRYAKRMDGQKAFTICGDPLYFSPELISQQGYGYGQDLWSFGVLLFEMIEGVNPFGAPDSEETAIFKAINSCSESKCKSIQAAFTTKSSDSAKRLVLELLRADAKDRKGYTDPDEVRGDGYFGAIDWSRLDEAPPGAVIDMTSAIDIATLFDEDLLQEFDNVHFEKF